MAARVKVAVFGASGSTGLELLRLLSRHPGVELAALTSREYKRQPVAKVFPALAGFVMIEHIDTYAPHLADNVGAFLYPSSDGSRFAVGHGYDGWFVVKTKYTEEAMKLLHWLVTDKLIDFYATLPIYYQPTRMSIYNDPRWKALPRVKKYANVVETTKNFLTRKDIVMDCVDIQGPEIDPRPGKITRKFVMPTMFQKSPP